MKKIFLTVLISVLLMSGFGYCMISQFVIPQTKYSEGIRLMEEGEYTAAVSAFTELNGYKESEEYIDKCVEAKAHEKTEQTYSEAKALMEKKEYEQAFLQFREIETKKTVSEEMRGCREALLENAKEGAEEVPLGSTFKLGFYEQDNNPDNGTEMIEWVVLSRDEKQNRALVISKYALDCLPYHTHCDDVTWENCWLRTWLNENFLTEAFSDEERELIPSVKVTADKNSWHKGTKQGNNTEDKIYLLSNQEVLKYFESDRARDCLPTEYAASKDCFISTDANNRIYGKSTTLWWLRTSGIAQYYACRVNTCGDVNYDGDIVNYQKTCVRPCMWIQW